MLCAPIYASPDKTAMISPHALVIKQTESRQATVPKNGSDRPRDTPESGVEDVDDVFAVLPRRKRKARREKNRNGTNATLVRQMSGSAGTNGVGGWWLVGDLCRGQPATRHLGPVSRRFRKSKRRKNPPSHRLLYLIFRYRDKQVIYTFQGPGQSEASRAQDAAETKT